ncbi:hypothetical protein [Bacillus sp. AFS017336]|uniref:hypothetical protein n=1 Tax=Bacillus sp. AFS017336 TaxID=2033489 RepID=UPI000BF20B93|nr:hypothetical protein [Bacillus sp. AFS017336]PEL08098.1 hypothetical protein CN601_17675 [Bacillus sp. AFS017336]
MLRNQADIKAYHQKYFRPSCLPALNLRLNSYKFFDPFYDKTYDQIQLPKELTNTAEDTIINYFSILREAENMSRRSCGTVGQARIPFPIAYNFLSKEYQKRFSYNDYFHSFAGIGHTSLIKLCRVPDSKGGIKFFYEIETIESFKNSRAEYFGYYYGFIKLIHEQKGYRISDVEQYPEDFLCAPYHGWDHDAEAVVDVKFGNWCKLIKKRHPLIQDEYVKYIYFDGNDGADYCLLFFTLTNGTDIEIAQFRRFVDVDWKQITYKPEKHCLTES